MTSKILLAAIAAVVLSGCSVIAPYDSQFQCHRNRDFGKCTDVAGAYSDALGGDVSSSGDDNAKTAKSKKKGKDKDVSVGEPLRADDVVARQAFNRYKAAEYDEMGRLIEAPVTPVVVQPKVLRSLVVAYATQSRTLYMPRYVYFFVTDGNFILGDYLNAEQRANEGGVMYPNGAMEGLH